MNIDPRSLGLFVASMAPLLLVVIFGEMIESAVGEVVWSLLFAAAAVCFFVCFVLYMRRLDEAAWQAQKDAWLWGGMIGMTAGILTLAMPFVSAPIAERVVAYAARAGEDTVSPVQAALVLGAVCVAVAQSIGFLVAWAIWWMRRT